MLFVRLQWDSDGNSAYIKLLTRTDSGRAKKWIKLSESHLEFNIRDLRWG